MSEEDRIDEIIRNAASDYNRPPATPRDEMWSAIETARANAAAGPKLHVTAGGSSTPGGYRDNNKFGTRYAWFGMAAAAVLLIATGVGIGRYTSKPTSAPIGEVPGVKVIAEQGPDVPLPAPEVGGSAPQPTTSAPDNSGTSSTSQKQPQRSHEDIVRNPHIVGKGTVMPLPGTQVATNSNEPGNGSGDVYTLATVRHLADADALLTSFSIGSHDAKMDAQFSAWAKGLLSNTRLLLDSPAGDDPRRAKLLQDLELVLAQIVQLSPNAAAADRELIQGSIQQGQVITRLRTAIPAGQQ